MIYLFLFICWYVIGVASFIYWCTKDLDFTLDELPLALLCGFIGPLSFIIGWFIHGEASFNNRIIIKRRK